MTNQLIATKMIEVMQAEAAVNGLHVELNALVSANAPTSFVLRNATENWTRFIQISETGKIERPCEYEALTGTLEETGQVLQTQNQTLTAWGFENANPPFARVHDAGNLLPDIIDLIIIV